MEDTKLAIDAGFRHIDCAPAYGNENEIGLAIQSKIEDGTVKRGDMFCNTKVCMCGICVFIGVKVIVWR